MKEKRAYHRIDHESPFCFRVPPVKDHIDSTLFDIGGTGVGFWTQDPPKVRQELLMYLSLPDNEKTEMHAKVVRVEEVNTEGAKAYKVGVRLSDRIKFDERAYVKFYADKLNEAIPATKKE